MVIFSTRLNHIAVDIVTTRQSGVVHVLYVAGDDNTVRKLTVVPRGSTLTRVTCLLEILQPLPRNVTNRILNLKFLKETVSFC